MRLIVLAETRSDRQCLIEPSDFGADVVRRRSFSPSYRHCVEERLHRRLAEAPAPVMGPRLIVLVNPDIEIGLQLVDETIHLFAERDTVKLIEHGLVEALADTVGLRALGLSARVIDVLDREVEFVLLPLWIAAVLATAVGQHA